MYISALWSVRGSPWPQGPKLWRTVLLYFTTAVIDTQANFLACFTYQYISINVAMLLDCFTIPICALLTWLYLGARYGPIHIATILVCLVGLSWTVYSDYIAHRSEDLSGTWKGYVMALSGATLYAFCNTLEEWFVTRIASDPSTPEKDNFSAPASRATWTIAEGVCAREVPVARRRQCIHQPNHILSKEGFCNRAEFLGWYSFFAMLICGIQAAAYDHRHIADAPWSGPLVGFLALYTVCMFLYASMVPFVLGYSGAVFLNISLLTSDFCLTDGDTRVRPVLWRGFDMPNPGQKERATLCKLGSEVADLTFGKYRSP